MIIIDKFKKTLIEIIDFIIGAIVFICALYGCAIFIKDLFNLNDIDSVCLIISFLMVGRFAVKLNSR